MRKVFALLLLLTMALLLAGCASVDANLTLREDGSGSRTVQVWVDEAAYRLALASGTPDPLAQIAAEAGRRGATVEPTSDYARKGLRLTQTFDRLGDIPPLPPLDDVVAARQSDWLSTWYTVTVTVNTGQLAALTKGMDKLPLSSLKLTYQVTLPGRIRSYGNAAAVSGNTLTWTLNPAAGDVQTLTATSEVPHDFTVPYGIAVVVVVAPLLIAVVVLTLTNVWQRRRDEHPPVALSGCLGVTIGLLLVICLALALLTGYLAVEGRVFQISPAGANSPDLTPTVSPTRRGEIPPPACMLLASVSSSRCPLFPGNLSRAKNTPLT
jgi:hypothetical protein